MGFTALEDYDVVTVGAITGAVTLMPITPIQMPMVPQIAHPSIDEPVRDPFAQPQRGTIDPAKILADEKLAILVASVNYPRQVSGLADPVSHPYLKYCLNYKDFLLAAGKVDRVIVFDFLKGETRSFTKGGPKDGRVNVRYGPLIIKNYRFVTYQDPKELKQPKTLSVKRGGQKRWYFTAVDDLATELHNDPDASVEYTDYKQYQGGKEKSLSISDVYGLFRVALAGQIVELHFFGHAFREGPIIVNTDFYASKYYDKDGRVRDFTNATLANVFGTPALAHSKASFAQQPVVCVWGCENDESARSKIESALDRLAKNRSANIDDALQVVRDKLANNYAAVFAKTMGFPVISALPGTYSVHEGETNDDTTTGFSPTLMHVNLTKCRRVLGFYERFKSELGITWATTGAFKGDKTFGRGYAIYKP